MSSAKQKKNPTIFISMIDMYDPENGNVIKAKDFERLYLKDIVKYKEQLLNER